MNLSAFNVWKFISIVAVLLFSMLIANVLKKKIPFLKRSLIPTSVLGGLLLLVVTTVFQAITGEVMFDTQVFSGFNGEYGDGQVAPLTGSNILEAITYHCLALGFISTSFKASTKKLTKERSKEIFNSGVTTVATYLLQAILGIGLTMLISATVMPSLFPASGVLLMFGFGQGTGQAYNYGNIFETASAETVAEYECGFAFQGGSDFGLAIAALGFLSACIGGVAYLNHMRNKGRLIVGKGSVDVPSVSDFQDENEIPLSESMDKFTVQVAIVFLTYGLTYLVLYLFSSLLPGLSSTFYGFNFLFGVLMATFVRTVINQLTKKKIIKRQYINNYLMSRLGGFFFDLMVVAGIAAINLFELAEYWWVLLILCVVGAVSTYLYNLFISKKLFAEYRGEQFLVMYGMLTGTASTGVILLREADPTFSTPAADNLVYQQFIAIVLGFPLLIIATALPKHTLAIWIVVIAYFIALNVVLFRSFLFKKRSKKTD